MQKKIWYIFFTLCLLSLLTPLWVFKELLFPFVTSKAFFFRVVIEAALPFYVYLLVADKKLRPNLRQPLNLVVLVFLAINIITSFTGVNVGRSLWGNFERMGGAWYLAHLAALFFYVQVIGQAGGVYLKTFFQSFIGVSLLVTLSGLSGWLGGPTLTVDPSLPGRVSSTFGNPIFFGSFLIIPLFLSVYFALQEKSKGMKALYWAAAGLQAIGIFASGTRGAAVGLIVGLLAAGVVYIIFTQNSKLRRYGLAALGVIVVLAGGLYFYKNKLPQGSTLYRLVNLRDTNTEARLVQWRMALQGAKKYPLLGVGPENYYVIFDEFYNPEMYKYDPSWFDKPHNYPLEILTSNGVFGLAAFAGIFAFALYALWKAYKAGLLGLLEACVLMAGLIAYEIQNLFVFDTVSASVAFYAFLGFAAFLLYESSQALEPQTQSSQLTAERPGFAANASFVAACLVILFVQYASNIASIKAAKQVNLGFIYTSHNVETAAKYFEEALSSKFNLDKRETSNYYSNFSAALVNQADSKVDGNFVLEQLQKARDNQKAITEKIKNDPVLWMRLSVDEMNMALAQGRSVESAKYAISSGAALAPNRAELLQLYIQYYSFLKDWKSLAQAAQKIVQLNPYQPELRWQLAMAYYLNGQTEEAVKAGDEALAQGFKFNQLQQFAWYIEYYQAKGDFEKVVPLLLQAVTLEPNEIGLYVELAKAYAKIGDIEQAILLAEQVKKSDPSQAAAMDAFIKSLR